MEGTKRGNTVAVAVMAKAPEAGRAKTRLVPPLDPAGAAALSAAFLRDVTENIAQAAREVPLVGYVAYAPAGAERSFAGVLADGTFLLLADGSPPMSPSVKGIGRSLLNAVQSLLSDGYAGVYLVNADGPTLPTRFLCDAARALLSPGERVVLGPAEDGGYYLIGMKAPHAHLFEDIDWSTERVAAQTRERARALGVELIELPAWYDVDDCDGLDRLIAELQTPTAEEPKPYAAFATVACIRRLGLRSASRLSRCAEGSSHSGWRVRVPLAPAPSPGSLREPTLGSSPRACLSRRAGEVKLAAAAMWRLAAFGVVLVALTVAGLSLHHPGALALPSVRAAEVFVAIAAGAAIVYFIAVATIMRGPMPRGAIWLVLGVALVMRVLVLPAPPFLSSDMYRYVWDGKVQNAGISPYPYIPDDPALTKLRDTAIYPHIGRLEYARTIYPPAAQLVFRAVAAISPTVLAMKAAMVGFELLGIGAVIAVLGRVGLPRERVLIYAWNPLTVWSFAGNGHADAIAIGLIGLALLARAVGRGGVTGALLGAATLVKFVPGVVAPAFWRRWDWRLPVAAGAVIVALYACYVDVGWRVLGYLPGYAREEGLDNGTGFWLLAGLDDVVHLPALAARLYAALAACALAGLAAWLAFRRRPEGDGSRADMVRVGGDAALLAAATMLALSPHYSWYYAWLALPCCLCPLRSVIYLSAAGLLLDVNPLDEHFLWPCLLFVPAIALGLWDLRLARSSRTTAPVSIGSPDAIGRSP